MRPHRRAGWYAVGPALAGAAAVVAATGKGLYVSPDSVFYVGTARNLLDGRGFTPPAGLPPLPHFPPLFTLLLAGIGRLGPDPLTVARAVNAVAFAAVVVLVGLVVRARTHSVVAVLVAAGLTACSADLLTYTAAALSEVLFAVLGLGGLVALAAHLDRPRRPLLVLAAALVAAACLTRYVGVALVVAGLAVLLSRRRVVDAGVFTALAVVPVLAWLVLSRGKGSDRSLAWHPLGADYLGQAARPFSRWLVPWPHPPVGLALAVVLVAAGVVLVARAPRPGSTSSLDRLLIVFAAAYLAVLFADRTVVDATGRLDARFLLPLHVVAILLVVPALYRRRLPAPALAVAGVLVVAQVAGAVAWTAGGLSDDGTGRRGYTAAAWRTSTVMARVAATDPRVPVYSNGYDAVAFLTHRSATPVPARIEYLTGRPNPRYDAQLEAMRADLERPGALLAYFDAATFRRSLVPSRVELELRLPLEVVAQDSVGTLYRLR